MNPEEVKTWYFKSLKTMLEGTNPQDRRTALAELGKIHRAQRAVPLYEDRTQQILSMVKDGKTYKEIADELGITAVY